MKFYTKPVLRFYIRWVCIGILVILPLYMAFAVWELAAEAKDGWILSAVCLLLAVCGIVLVSYAFWEKFFATLWITEDVIEWRCPFRKTRRIRLSECRFTGVEVEESYNGLPYPFIWFSVSPYPVEFRNKINKVQNSDTFIKFWYTEQLAQYLIDHFPGKLSGPVLAYRICRKRKKD